MPLSAEVLSEEAMALPASGRAKLVEQLLASLAGEVDPAVERRNLEEVKRRRASVKEGKAKLIDGDEALARACAAIRK